MFRRKSFCDGHDASYLFDQGAVSSKHLAQALDDWTHFFFFFFFFFFTFKTFSINPQSTLVYGLLYRQGRKRGVLV